VGDVHSGGGYPCVRAKGLWEIFVPSSKSPYEPKTDLKVLKKSFLVVKYIKDYHLRF